MDVSDYRHINLLNPYEGTELEYMRVIWVHPAWAKLWEQYDNRLSPVITARNGHLEVSVL
jgi:hypothetical protein